MRSSLLALITAHSVVVWVAQRVVWLPRRTSRRERCAGRNDVVWNHRNHHCGGCRADFVRVESHPETCTLVGFRSQRVRSRPHTSNPSGESGPDPEPESPRVSHPRWCHRHGRHAARRRFPRASFASTTDCSAGACATTTVWMLDRDWGYPRGPHAKTRLVSRASRAAAANRIARTEADTLDMNLHLCSWAPAVAVQLSATRVDATFESYATNWANPWSGTTVSLVDMRSLPADFDPFDCPASSPVAQPTAPTRGSGEPGESLAVLGAESRTTPGGAAPLAFTGGTDRRLLFTGLGGGHRGDHPANVQQKCARIRPINRSATRD